MARDGEIVKRTTFFTRWGAHRYQRVSEEAAEIVPAQAGLLEKYGPMWICEVVRRSATLQ